MELPRPTTTPLTPAQQQAVAARGNVLVMAGAGTGKTKTLVARCLDCLQSERVSLDRLLIVTFTEAAAAEMRQRLRRELEKLAANEPNDEYWPRQLALFDTAHIGTLHSFCLRLVREHFYELGFDPQFSVLDEIQCRLLVDETLDVQFKAHYERKTPFSAAVLELIQAYGGGNDDHIRSLIRRLHQYTQARPNPEQWLKKQLAEFEMTEPELWLEWLLEAIADWCNEWLPLLQQLRDSNPKAAELLVKLQRLTGNFDRSLAAQVLVEVMAADRPDQWPPKKKTTLREPLEKLFEQAQFLVSLARVNDNHDPLKEDWIWVRQHMTTLLRLTEEFTAQYALRKQSDGLLDFPDLEQFALRLLWDFKKDRPTSTAIGWREKFCLVLVDEYQDINAAQDQIISALARENEEANRFLVGDIKQSIYRFRLADPGIFRLYAREWRRPAGQTIALSDNFRSREGLLDFVNSVFQVIQRQEVGGVEYDDEACLRFGAPEQRSALSMAANSASAVELLLRPKTKVEASSTEENDELADLEESQKEARLAARHLKQIYDNHYQVWDDAIIGFRPVSWRDMTVLLRSPRSKSAAFAKEFERQGVPLAVERGGFYDSSEILDLLSLLQLLDNPLQDVPCLAVLRSPMVGLTLDQLAEIRSTARNRPFWTALNHSHVSAAIQDENLKSNIGRFLESFATWRTMVRQVSLSQCLETVLSETHYLEWLKAQPRGMQRASNVERFLRLAEQFDQFQRQGLYRFLQFIEAQQKIEAEPEVPAVAAMDAVRLMSIHQSKGLEFPVVLIADLAKSFNEQDFAADIILDENYGLCPRVKPPQRRQSYPSLSHWLAKQHQRRELRGEELRLLYVAFTRARDRLVLLASVSPQAWEKCWQTPNTATLQAIAAGRSYTDWLRIWFNHRVADDLELKNHSPTSGNWRSVHWRLVQDDELAGHPETYKNASHRPASVVTAEFNNVARAQLQAISTWEYAFTAAIGRKAKASVTELRQGAALVDEEAEPIFSTLQFSAKRSSSGLSATAFGTAHHTFLQLVSLKKAGSRAELAAEAERLGREQILSADDLNHLDIKAIADFFSSPLGKQIQRNADLVRRELPFTASFSPAEISKIVGVKMEPSLAGETIIVQGVVDLVIQWPEEMWLIDFKTDAVKPEGLPEKIRRYTPQIKLYAGALERTFPARVTQSWLHFLALNQSIPVK